MAKVKPYIDENGNIRSFMEQQAYLVNWKEVPKWETVTIPSSKSQTKFRKKLAREFAYAFYRSIGEGTVLVPEDDYHADLPAIIGYGSVKASWSARFVFHLIEVRHWLIPKKTRMTKLGKGKYCAMQYVNEYRLTEEGLKYARARAKRSAARMVRENAQAAA